MKPPRISPIKSPAATLPNDSDGSVQKKKRERTSKLKRLGDVLRQGLLESNSLRREHRLSNKANAAILSVLTVAIEGDVTKNASVLSAGRLLRGWRKCCFRLVELGAS